jgi:hypothetical protein
MYPYIVSYVAVRVLVDPLDRSMNSLLSRTSRSTSFGLEAQALAKPREVYSRQTCFARMKVAETARA